MTSLAGVTHPGTVRSRNEDCFAFSGIVEGPSDGQVLVVRERSGPTLVIVADGLGGHPDGDQASALAADVVIRAHPETGEELVAVVHEANRRLRATLNDEGRPTGMATTVAALLLGEHGIAVVNVGDSAVFELVGSRLTKLSTDDRLEGLGSIPGLPSFAVTQSVGGWGPRSIDPHLYEDDLRGRRRFLLCTDGVTNYVSQRKITSALSRPDLEDSVQALLGLSLRVGGHDNVTCVVVDTDCG